MAITSLEEKENRKIWVPIRGGNRGGWSLFDWEKVREMPYRDREMYLGNSAKIGVLDKGGKWRKKDWYLKKNDIAQGEELDNMRSQAIRKDMERMNAALGYVDKEQQEEKLTPAEMQMLLKRVRGDKETFQDSGSDTVGLGFNKLKVEIRAKPTDKTSNPHRLEGNCDQQEDRNRKEGRRDSEERRKRKEQRKKQKRQRKEKKQRNEEDEQHNTRKDIHRRSRSRDHKQKREKRKSISEQRQERRKHSSKHHSKGHKRHHRDSRQN